MTLLVSVAVSFSESCSVKNEIQFIQNTYIICVVLFFSFRIRFGLHNLLCKKWHM